MDKLDMFQFRSGKIDEFGWWYLERISADAGTQFTWMEFKDECQTRGASLTLEAPEHQEMNRLVEVIWRRLRTVAHSLMVHARVPEAYVHFVLMYATNHIFLVLPIKGIIMRMAIQQRHTNFQQVRNLQYDIYACYFVHVLYKSLRRTVRQTINMCHQAQKRFWGIFVGIPEHQKGYHVYDTTYHV